MIGERTFESAGPPALVLTRVFDASPRRVFEAWTRPEQVVRGWGLPGFVITALRNEPWPGGQHRTSLRAPDGDETLIEGVYREFCPPRRLAFTQRWKEHGVLGPETLVTVDLVLCEGDRTLTRVELHGVATPAELALYRAGSSECLDRIADYLRQTPWSGPDRLRYCGCAGHCT